MYLKIMGSIMIIASSSLVGIYLANKEAFRIKDLLEVRKAFSILKSEIEFTRTPLPEASLVISQRIERSIADIFETIADKLSQKGSDSICDIWSETFLKETDNTYLTNEDRELLASFGKTVGSLDASVQSIHLMMQSIDGKIDALRESSLKSKKMYQSLGVLGGILICVILV